MIKHQIYQVIGLQNRGHIQGSHFYKFGVPKIFSVFLVSALAKLTFYTRCARRGGGGGVSENSLDRKTRVP